MAQDPLVLGPVVASEMLHRAGAAARLASDSPRCRGSASGATMSSPASPRSQDWPVRACAAGGGLASAPVSPAPTRRGRQVMGLAELRVPGIEADDVIGTVATRAADAGFHVAIASPDKARLFWRARARSVGLAGT